MNQSHILIKIAHYLPCLGAFHSNLLFLVQIKLKPQSQAQTKSNNGEIQDMKEY